MNWFYGFKFHLLINHLSEHNTRKYERPPVLYLCKNLTVKFYADKGYIDNKLTEKLSKRDIDLVTTVRKNMNPKVIFAFHKAMLLKRYIIETIIDQL